MKKFKEVFILIAFVCVYVLVGTMWYYISTGREKIIGYIVYSIGVFCYAIGLLND